MSTPLPDQADPSRLCGLGKVYEGVIGLGEFDRLSLLLADTAGEATFRLAFSKDDDRRDVVKVSVEATLALQCQRCMGTVMQQIASTSDLAVVTGSDEAERLPDSLDPLLIDDDLVALRELIEDELMLSVPNAPMHGLEECEVRLNELNTAPADSMVKAMQQPPSPFAALASLKSDKETND